MRVDQLEVPEGMRLVLGRRLERLSEDARRILTTAAVMRRTFPLELLEDLENDRPDAARVGWFVYSPTGRAFGFGRWSLMILR